MVFTKDEAATKVGKRVRLCTNLLSCIGLEPGTTGTVIDARLLFTVELRSDAIGTPSMPEGDWEVVVQFDGRRAPSALPFCKEEYKRSLEEIP